MKIEKVLAAALAVFLIMSIMAGCQQDSIAVSDTAAQELKPLTKEEMLEDFEYLYTILEENYPFFEVNKRLNGVDWLANKNKYLEMIRIASNDQEYVVILNTILAELNNRHTHIVDKEFYDYLKVGLDPKIPIWQPWLEQLNMEKAVLRYSDSDKKDENTISQSKDANAYIDPDNVETKILLPNKVAYMEIKSFKPLNIEGEMNIIRPFLEEVKDYEALIIDIRNNGGGGIGLWAESLVPMLIDEPVHYNTYFVYRGGKFTEKFAKARMENPDKVFKNIGEITKEELTNAPVELLDNYMYYTKNEHVIEPRDSVSFKGKIYLLVGEGVYSAAEAFAFFAKCTGFATLVGETTGGDGLGLDTPVCTLPNSGYIFRFPFVMGLTADGSCNEEHKTQPDIAVPALKTDNIEDDECIQYILNLYK